MQSFPVSKTRSSFKVPYGLNVPSHQVTPIPLQPSSTPLKPPTPIPRPSSTCRRICKADLRREMQSSTCGKKVQQCLRASKTDPTVMYSKPCMEALSCSFNVVNTIGGFNNT